ncbi:hypothetical protein ACFWNG_18470 [Streptomyces sp. NPDC058391]|uniref:hypothetical protein n=1 Tax=Streptomyces sp. NPDC058391 TaxID=3346476 RepID=UPI00364C5B57
MADTREKTPERPVPDGEAKSRTGGTAMARTSRVRLSLWRWVLAPRTTWQARRLAAELGPGMDADTAWTMARLARHPDERVYAMHHLNGDSDGSAPAETRTP